MTEPAQGPEQPPHRKSAAGYTTHILRGVCMGAADVIPGVSGGTIALLLGVYQRLVTAISRVDRQLFALLAGRKWSAAAAYVDLFFLISLGTGILLGFVLTLNTVYLLLENLATRPFVLAAFFGLVLASAWIVGSRAAWLPGGRAPGNWLWAMFGCAVSAAVSIAGPAGQAAQPSLAYLFFCGALAICAMILPGISGALILLLLGVYQFLVGVAKELLSLQRLTENLTICLVFGGGCMLGLLMFSKLLRYLLEHRRAQTLWTLTGLMGGSLLTLWPFQRDVTPAVEQFRDKVFRPQWPTSPDAWCGLVLSTALVCAVLTVLVDWQIHRPVNRRQADRQGNR